MRKKGSKRSMTPDPPQPPLSIPRFISPLRVPSYLLLIYSSIGKHCCQPSLARPCVTACITDHHDDVDGDDELYVVEWDWDGMHAAMLIDVNFDAT